MGPSATRPEFKPVLDECLDETAFNYLDALDHAIQPSKHEMAESRQSVWSRKKRRELRGGPTPTLARRALDFCCLLVFDCCLNLLCQIGRDRRHPVILLGVFCPFRHHLRNILAFDDSLAA